MPEGITRSSGAGAPDNDPKNAIVRRTKIDAQEQLDNAVSDGLDRRAATIIRDHLDGYTLSGSSGRDVGSLPGEDVILVTLILDKSGSMQSEATTVRECYTGMVTTLQELAGQANIQISTWTFDGHKKLMYGFLPVEEVPQVINYRPDGSTALYDTVLTALSSQVLYTQEVWSKNKGTKNIVIVLSDGEDCASVKDENGAKTRELAHNLIEQGDYILAYVAFGCSSGHELARRVGFNEVISTGKTSEDIARIFRMIAESVIRISECTDLATVSRLFE